MQSPHSAREIIWKIEDKAVREPQVPGLLSSRGPQDCGPHADSLGSSEDADAYAKKAGIKRGFRTAWASLESILGGDPAGCWRARILLGAGNWRRWNDTRSCYRVTLHSAVCGFESVGSGNGRFIYCRYSLCPNVIRFEILNENGRLQHPRTWDFFWKTVVELLAWDVCPCLSCAKGRVGESDLA